MLPYLLAIAILLLLLALTIFTLLYISGLFEIVTVHRQPPPTCLSRGSLFAYKLHDGPYDQAGYLFTETSSISSNRIQCGIHFMDLDETTSPRNSAVGALLNENDDDTARETFEDAGFHVVRLPPIEEALVVSFPHTSFLSIRIGSCRVYGRLRSYSAEHNLKVTGFLELYDGDWIHYVGLLKDEEPFRQLLATQDDEEVDDDDDDADGEEASKEHESTTVETLHAASDLPSPSGDARTSLNDLGTEREMDELEATFEKITSVPEPVTPQ